MERKVVIITSCAKGIGKELALLFAKNNYDVVITYNTSKNMAYELSNFINDNYKVNTLIIKCDLKKESDILGLKQKVLKKYKHIDVLINNAALSLDNSIEEKTKKEFMDVLEVNVVGTFLVTKNLLKFMDKGVVVNISSTDSIDTYSTLNIDYSASKASINMLTKTFALSYPNIKFISVLPNWTNTESIREMNQDYLKSELKRIGQNKLADAKEVANNIVKLINDKKLKSGEIRRV